MHAPERSVTRRDLLGAVALSALAAPLTAALAAASKRMPHEVAWSEAVAALEKVRARA